MLVLVNVFRQILFGRRGPDALPASEPLFLSVLLIYVIIGEMYLFFSRIAGVNGQIILIISVAMPLSLIWLVLASQGRGPRFLQTATAYLGADLLLNALAMPFASIYASRTQNLPPSQYPPSAEFAQLMLVVTQFWSIWLLAFVVSRALGRSIWIGLAVAGLNLLFVMSAVLMLVPVDPLVQQQQ